MSSNQKNVLAILFCVVAVGGSALWIYWREFKRPQHDVELHRHIGEVMAEQTARVAGPKGKIVVIAIPTGGQPELKTQLEAFYAALKKHGSYDVRDYEMDTKDQDKYGLGTGLSGRRYVRTANKNVDASVMVSFIGAPNVKEDEARELQKVPKLVAEARSVDHLADLFKRELISVAIASRYSFPAPGPIQPRTTQERFDKLYQVVAAKNVAALPVPE